MPLSPRTLVPSSSFTPRSISGLALWLDASDTQGLYTTDAGPVTAVSAPTEISGCLCWYDAADTSSITKDGSNLVSQWNDKSGNNRHATTSGSLRPTHGGSQNGNPVMQFTGTQAMTITGNFLQSENVTMFAVAMKNSDHYGGIITSAPSNPEDSPLLGFYSTTIAFVNRRQVVQQAVSNSVYRIVCGQANGTAQQGWFNGVKGTDSVASATPNTAGTITKIGAFRTADTADLNGNIAEIVCYSGNLSTTDRARVESYLAAKWGISGVHKSAAQEIAPVSSPKELAGCALWLDASDASTISATSGAVDEWRDKSGNLRHYTAATTARPSTGTRTQNGLNVIDFDGTNNQMAGNAASLSLFRNVSSGHVLVALKMDSTAANPFIFSSSTASAGHLNRAQVFVDGSGNLSIGGRRLDADAFDYIAVPSVPTVPTVLSAHFDWANSDLLFRRDGIVVASKTTFQTDGSTSDTNSVASVIGGAGAGFRLDGCIAEIIVFNAALSTTDRARVEKYLQQKWGTPTVPDPTPPVGYWRDRSGNNRHAVQATAGSRPTISATAQNGRKQVALTSTSGNALRISSFGMSAPFSLLAVVRKDARAIATFASSTDQTRLQFGDGSATYSGGFYGASRVGGAVYGSAPIAIGRHQIFSAVADSGTLPSSLSMWSDGIGGQSAVLTAGTAPANSIGNSLAVGGDGTGSWGGTVCEMIAYPKSLTLPERQRLERYLAARWGITLAPQVSNADAQDWVNRVYQNGGTVSASTAAAVNQFCVDCESAGIRDRFYRLNLFVGSFQGAFVPLFRTWKVYSGRNLLSTGDNLSVSGWTKSGTTVTQSTSERPFAYGPYANVVTATAGTSVTPYVAAQANNYGYGTVTYSAYLKANGQTTVRILLAGSSGQTFPGGGTVAYANINLSTGAVSNVLAGTSATATDVGNGWWRFSYTCANNSTGNASVRYDIGGGSAYNAAGTESVFIWGVQSEVGSVATDFDPYPLGNTTDTNNAFVGVGTDYAETGASGGLKGNGSSKYLATGLTPTALPSLATGHIACYRAAGAAANQTMIAVRSATDYYELLKRGDSRHHAAWGATSLAVASGSEPSHEDAGLRLVSRTNATTLRYFQNASLIAEQTASVTPAGTTRDWYVFAMNQGTLANYWGNATSSLSIPLRGYSIGEGMTDSQVTAYTNAMATFQTALSRA